MEPQIVNENPAYAPVHLIEPSAHGYIHIAAAVHPGRIPLILPNRDRSRTLVALDELVRQLEEVEGVVRASVFRAIVMPPTVRMSEYLRERGDAVQAPRFDVVVLVETASPDASERVEQTPQYLALIAAMRHAGSGDVQVMEMRNVKRIADVPTSDGGLFLFNYFVADDPDTGLALWDYLAGWYAAETGLDNSMVLAPVDGQQTGYSFVNFAKWDESLPRFLWQQASTKSFRSYVLGNLAANRVGAMPVLYRHA